MTHLVIQQKKVLEGGSRESVTSAFIKKLYDYANDANLVYQSTDLKGDLSVDKTYQDYINFLTTRYPGLSIDATSVYLRFADPVVEAYWANSQYGDGTGITAASALTATTIPSGSFRDNTSVQQFNELNQFGITSIGSNCFRGCSNLTSINTHKIQSFGDGAFYQSGITSIDLLSATSLGESLFYGCTGLTTVNNSSNLTTLNASAFYGCSALSSIDFSNVTTFGNACFQGCSSLGVGQDLDMDLDGKSCAANAFRGTGYRSITLHETTKHKISDFSGSGQEDAFGTRMPNLVKFDLSDTKQTSITGLYSGNLVTLIFPETYTGSLSRGREWATGLLYVVCLNTNPVASMKPDSYWGFVQMSNNFAIYVPDSAYNDYVDVFITNSNDPISSSRLKRISELPSSVTWYTKEHPST